MDIVTLAAAKKYTNDAIAEAATGEVDLSAYATTSYVDGKVAGIVESAPDALNTLNELAAALGDDPNFATTIANDIGSKVPSTRTINNKALSGNISLTASDVGAVPTTRTVNGKALSANITLSAADVDALPSSTPLFSGSYNDLTDKPTIPSIDGFATETYVNNAVVNAMILNSTTEGSTKKFKVTVDDSGTLTAVEITE